MKKLMLIGVSFIMRAGFLPVNGVSQNNGDIGMHCVGTCLGVYCHDDFKNIQYVIDYIDAAQDVCDDIEKKLDFID